MISKKKKIRINDVEFGGKPVFVAGPCALECFSLVEEAASFLEDISKKNNIKIIFKLSYDKANRTSIDSFRGPGLKKGIDIISKIKDEYNLPLLIDVHCKYEVDDISKIADCIQIPAFLCRQTSLLTEAGKTGLPVNIKKGQFI
ncbi:MAG: 3-deoxy-8-phosphooctulonate synthase, partial [Elusimicrobiota bacterium]